MKGNLFGYPFCFFTHIPLMHPMKEKMHIFVIAIDVCIAVIAYSLLYGGLKDISIIFCFLMPISSLRFNKFKIQVLSIKVHIFNFQLKSAFAFINTDIC
jgi:hypothetical protein